MLNKGSFTVDEFVDEFEHRGEPDTLTIQGVVRIFAAR